MQTLQADGGKGLGLSLERLLIVGGVIAMSHATMGFIIASLPRFVSEIGGTGIAIGLALSAAGVSRFMTNIPAGLLAERFGRKKVLVAGGLGVGIFASVSGTATGIPMFLAYRFMVGLFSAMTQTAGNVALADLTTVQNRGRALGLTHGAQLIVGIVSPGLGGLLATVVDTRVPFYVSGVGALLFAGWALVRLPETRPVGRPTERRAVDEGQGQSWIAGVALLKNNSFLLVCFLGFAQFFTRTGASHSLIPLFADRMLSLGPGELGLFFSGAAVLHGLIVYPSGVIADRFGRKMVIIPGNLGVAAGLVLLPFTDSVFLFAIAFIIIHWSNGFGGQAPTAYMGDIAPPGLRGWSFGLYRTFGDMAGMMAPVLLTALAAATGFVAAFAVNAVMVVVITVMFGKFAVESAGDAALQKETEDSTVGPPDRRQG